MSGLRTFGFLHRLTTNYKISPEYADTRQEPHDNSTYNPS